MPILTDAERRSFKLRIGGARDRRATVEARKAGLEEVKDIRRRGGKFAYYEWPTGLYDVLPAGMPPNSDELAHSGEGRFVTMAGLRRRPQGWDKDNEHNHMLKEIRAARDYKEEFEEQIARKAAGEKNPTLVQPFNYSAGAEFERMRKAKKAKRAAWTEGARATSKDRRAAWAEQGRQRVAERTAVVAGALAKEAERAAEADRVAKLEQAKMAARAEAMKSFGRVPQAPGVGIGGAWARHAQNTATAQATSQMQNAIITARMNGARVSFLYAPYKAGGQLPGLKVIPAGMKIPDQYRGFIRVTEKQARQLFDGDRVETAIYNSLRSYRGKYNDMAKRRRDREHAKLLKNMGIITPKERSLVPPVNDVVVLSQAQLDAMVPT